MSNSQRELRRAAAKAFMESLDQLGMSLGSPDSDPSEVRSLGDSSEEIAPPLPQVDEALEAAAADIEQFIEAKEAEQ